MAKEDKMKCHYCYKEKEEEMSVVTDYEVKEYMCDACAEKYFKQYNLKGKEVTK